MLNGIEKYELCVFPCQTCQCAERIIQPYQYQDNYCESYMCCLDENNERILDKVNTYCRKYGTFVISEFKDRITKLPPKCYLDHSAIEMRYNTKPFVGYGYKEYIFGHNKNIGNI